MAIKRPDLYEHQNPVLAIADSDSVRGGGRTVADLTALYALADRPDQLKQYVTKVYVQSAAADMRLIGLPEQAGLAASWEMVGSAAGGGDVTKAYVDAADAHLQDQILALEDDVNQVENDVNALENEVAGHEDRLDLLDFVATAAQYNPAHPAFNGLREAVIWLLGNWNSAPPIVTNHYVQAGYVDSSYVN